MTQKNVLIVYGMGSDRRPHAAAFYDADEALVRKAANLMRFTVGSGGEDLMPLAKKLPNGRLFAAGKAFVPYIKQPLYDQIQSRFQIELPDWADNDTIANPWKTIKAGDTVVCRDRTQPTGWWDAIVLSVDGNKLTLKWRDFPEQKPYSADKRTVAVIGPAFAE